MISKRCNTESDDKTIMKIIIIIIIIIIITTFCLLKRGVPVIESQSKMAPVITRKYS